MNSAKLDTTSHDVCVQCSKFKVLPRGGSVQVSERVLLNKDGKRKTSKCC